MSIWSDMEDRGIGDLKKKEDLARDAEHMRYIQQLMKENPPEPYWKDWDTSVQIVDYLSGLKDTDFPIRDYQQESITLQDYINDYKFKFNYKL